MPIETINIILASIVNLASMLTAILLFFRKSPIYLKRRKSIDTKIFINQYLLYLILVLLLNILYCIVVDKIYYKIDSKPFLRYIFLSKDSFFFNYIFTILGLVSNLLLLIPFNIFIDKYVKKKNLTDAKLKSNLIMPSYAALLFWWINILFVVNRWDLDILFNSFFSYILSIFILAVAFVIPITNIYFKVLAYKFSIYTVHSKFPIHLDGITSEFIAYEDYYHINYYDKELKEITRQVILPKSEVVKIVKISDNKIVLN